MVVGYALGNRSDLDSDIQVLDEDQENVVTYSKNIQVALSKVCLSTCMPCAKRRRENLTVPYSTIKFAKLARLKGAREILYTANERPDRYPHVKALLELWGFSSYLDYLYTVTELGFLEGLVPVVDLGFLTPQEIRRIAEVCGAVKIPLTSNHDREHQSIFKRSFDKNIEIRYKNIEWACKLAFPVNTGVVVGGDVTRTQVKEQLNSIAGLSNKYGFIHEVTLEARQPIDGAVTASKKDLLAAFEAAKNILPEGVSIVVSAQQVGDVMDLVRAGLRDLGAISISNRSLKAPSFSLEEMEGRLIEEGFKFVQRFPLNKHFIFAEKYSKKLGQVFDPYRYKIKKDFQERQKKEPADKVKG